MASQLPEAVVTMLPLGLFIGSIGAHIVGPVHGVPAAGPVQLPFMSQSVMHGPGTHSATQQCPAPLTPQMAGTVHSELPMQAAPRGRGWLQAPFSQLPLMHWSSAVHEEPFAIFARQVPVGPG
jgi:hypothetical protein